MKNKVYGIYGRTTAVLRIPTGNGMASIEVEFNRGIPNEGPNYRPATFSTSDPIVQDIMEKSKMFNNVYVLYREREEPDAAPAVVKKGRTQTKANAGSEIKTPEPVNTEVPEVTNHEEAVAYLKAKGAKATDLKDAESMQAYAAKIGVTFPNYTI